MDDEQLEIFVKAILLAPRVFLLGAGRSSLVGRAFATRLMHLDIEVHIIGGTTTPAVQKDDLLISISGSGKSKIRAVEISIDQGSKIASITSYPDSSLGRLADTTLIVPGRKREEMNMSFKEMKLRNVPIAPMGTLFELLALVLLDSIISHLVIEKGKKPEDLKKRHANPE